MTDNKKALLCSASPLSSLTAAVLAALLAALDQLTKRWAERALADRPLVLIEGVFEFRYLENRGMAFSLLQNQMAFFYVGTVLFFAAALYFWFRLPSGRRMRPLRLILIFLVAGGIGNFIDRVQLRYVRDFLYFSLIDFPIFNVADIYVTVSAVLLALLVFFYYKDEDFDGIFSFGKKRSTT